VEQQGSESSGDRPKPKRKKKRAVSDKTKKQRALGAAAQSPASDREPLRKGPAAPSSRALMLAVLTLIVGGAVGWIVRGLRGGGDLSAGPDPALTGSAAAAAASGGPCAAWSTTICEKAGPTSEACTQAKSAADLLPANACNQALADVPGTLEKVKNSRASCDELMTKLCNDIGPETQTCKNIVQQKIATFPASRCKQLMGNYDQVLTELKNQEKQNAPISAEEAAKQRAGTGPAFGPEDAKVAIIEYSDFECPYCSKAADAVKQLKERYGKVVRFVFRQYPLPFHQNAQLASEAALAAHAQGKFWPYHDLLFANQKALDRASLEKYAQEVGLDMAKFKKALDDHTYASAIKDDMKLGEAIGVSGTPTMIVGTERVANPTEFSVIAGMIDGKLKAAGVPIPEGKAEDKEKKGEPKAPGKAPGGPPGHEGHGH
jgi:protein-disulfide isomerase